MKIVIKIILLLSLSFLFLMCATRKKTVEKERVVYKRDTVYLKDSIYINKEKLILLPTVNREVISNPCDSAGNLKVIERVIKIPFGNVEIKSEGNQLITKVNTDSINSIYEVQYRERNEKQLHQINEIQKENTLLKITPFPWWMIGCIASLMVNVFLLFLYVKNKFIS